MVDDYNAWELERAWDRVRRLVVHCEANGGTSEHEMLYMEHV